MAHSEKTTKVLMNR